MRRSAVVNLSLTLATAVAWLGCDRDSATRDQDSQPAPAAAVDAARGEPDAVYTVRGRVMMVPEPGKPQTEFQVHHEAVPDFKGFDGRAGMESMVMPFPLAARVTLEGIGPGDAVEIDLAVWTKPGQRAFEARRVSRLPTDTPLKLDE